MLLVAIVNILVSILIAGQEKLNEAIMVMNKSLQVCQSRLCPDVLLRNTLQEVNIQNMNVELVAQMFKNYQSNVLFHLEGTYSFSLSHELGLTGLATENLKEPSQGE